MSVDVIALSYILAWVTATATAAFTMIAYVHKNFMTTREKEDLLAQLARIEAKVDLVLQR